MNLRRMDRGFSLIEGMIAIVIMLIGLLGLASLQVVGVRANSFGRHMQQASMLASDLAENIERWDYNDTRISPTTLRTWNVSNSSDTSTMDSKYDLGRADAPSLTSDFSDKVGDSKATVANALGTTYAGLSSDTDGDGTPDFVRYWNVWGTTINAAEGVTGKTIQIIVRWKEPGFGWRQITTLTFKAIPNALDTST